MSVADINDLVSRSDCRQFLFDVLLVGADVLYGDDDDLRTLLVIMPGSKGPQRQLLYGY
jgi:hypothetical protein